MRILLTGASSFTGYWFATEMARRGHEVVATFRGRSDSYDGVRARRVAALARVVCPVWDTVFGDERFLDLVRVGQWNLLCHHAAEMTDYRSRDFDTLAASAANTRNARLVLQELAGRGCHCVMLTGSVFEPYEGVGDTRACAFSPYALSKHVSFEIFRLEAEALDLCLGKFVIPNPFGPFEELRFTSYLANEWSHGRTPIVVTPAYVRDNIHVSLLAHAYAAFCEGLDGSTGVRRSAPSGYVESQGTFAARLGREVGVRLGRSFELTLANQMQFDEPATRVNSEPAAPAALDWSEAVAWDELAAYYDETFFRAAHR